MQQQIRRTIRTYRVDVVSAQDKVTFSRSVKAEQLHYEWKQITMHRTLINRNLKEKGGVIALCKLP